MAHQPTENEKQVIFLLLNHVREAMYGGAAGGGKSDGLLMAALQYVDMSGYAALLLRRTYSDLALPDAIMSRAQEWLMPTDAHWNAKDKTWTFPSSATLSFGYLQHENDKYRYQSSAFQFIGFDELTQFTQTQYLYLFSRLRRLRDVTIPLRMRSATNPGNIGHEWVKARFVTPANTRDRIFVPAGLDDNPHIDRDEYIKSLMELDIVTRERLLHGDWEVSESGGIFRREWFPIVDALPPANQFQDWACYWDTAGTEPSGANPDPDYTAGILMGRHQSGRYYIPRVLRVQYNSAEVERLISSTAQQDGREVRIGMEQEPGSSGKAVISHYRRNVLDGYWFKGYRVTGSKLDRARPVSPRAEAGDIVLVRGKWNESFLQEISAFTGDGKLHDDQVDALSGVFEMVSIINEFKIYVV